MLSHLAMCSRKVESVLHLSSSTPVCPEDWTCEDWACEDWTCEGCRTLVFISRVHHSTTRQMEIKRFNFKQLLAELPRGIGKEHLAGTETKERNHNLKGLSFLSRNMFVQSAEHNVDSHNWTTSGNVCTNMT